MEKSLFSWMAIPRMAEGRHLDPRVIELRCTGEPVHPDEMCDLLGIERAAFADFAQRYGQPIRSFYGVRLDSPEYSRLDWINDRYMGRR